MSMGSWRRATKLYLCPGLLVHRQFWSPISLSTMSQRSRRRRLSGVGKVLQMEGVSDKVPWIEAFAQFYGLLYCRGMMLFGIGSRGHLGTRWHGSCRGIRP